MNRIFVRRVARTCNYALMNGLSAGSRVIESDGFKELAVASWTPRLYSSAVLARPSSSTSTDSPQLRQLEFLAGEIIGAPATRSTEVLTQQFCDIYAKSDPSVKCALLELLTTTFAVNNDNAQELARAFLANQDRGEAYLSKSGARLRQTLTPRFMTLFNKIGRIEEGVKFLVDLRSDLLRLKSSSSLASDEPAIRRLKAMSDQLRNLLAMWFSVGLLSLERVTWNSPCYLLEKISSHEAVHPLRSWTDLKRRVGPYRRCYVFTHSCLPRQPLVILHIALTKDISSSIADIVKTTSMTGPGDNQDLSLSATTSVAQNETNPSQVNAAIFYSISSPQRGLHGIELGTQMIREVGRKIVGDFPNISKFSSLSPIPGFREYLLAEIQSVLKGDAPTVANFIRSDEFPLLEARLLEKSDEYDGSNDVWQILAGELRSNRWVADERLVQLLRMPLMRKCAHYLYGEKRRAYALNSVAHFHLRNGAVMWRLNWRADLSARGLSNSCGIMINYRYYIEDMDKFAQKYMEERHIESSEAFLQFVR